jgi:hypothetical protein
MAIAHSDKTVGAGPHVLRDLPADVFPIAEVYPRRCHGAAQTSGPEDPAALLLGNGKEVAHEQGNVRRTAPSPDGVWFRRCAEKPGL